MRKAMLLTCTVVALGLGAWVLLERGETDRSLQPQVSRNGSKAGEQLPANAPGAEPVARDSLPKGLAIPELANDAPSWYRLAPLTPRKDESEGNFGARQDFTQDYLDFLKKADVTEEQRRRIEGILADLQVNYHRYLQDALWARHEAHVRQEEKPRVERHPEELKDEALAQLAEVLTEEQMRKFPFSDPVVFVLPKPFDIQEPDQATRDAS